MKTSKNPSYAIPEARKRSLKDLKKIRKILRKKQREKSIAKLAIAKAKIFEREIEAVLAKPSEKALVFCKCVKCKALTVTAGSIAYGYIVKQSKFCSSTCETRVANALTAERKAKQEAVPKKMMLITTTWRGGGQQTYRKPSVVKVQADQVEDYLAGNMQFVDGLISSYESANAVSENY